MSARPKFCPGIRAYTDAGLALCRIKPNSKEATGAGWNKTTLPADAVLNDGEGLGVLLAASGLCSLDLDNLTAARGALSAAGVDLDALLTDPASVHILSGKPGRDKLLFRTPMGMMLPTMQVRDQTGMVYELRSGDTGGGSVQDVLPVPTHCHPDTGKPYEWSGDWRSIPALPDTLLAHWFDLIEQRSKGGGSVDPDPSITPAMVEGMLATQSADCPRIPWRNYGMAVQQQFGDAGFPLWNAWSATASGKGEDGKPRYPGSGAAWQQYRSFKADKAGGITIATLIDAALKAGWQDPRIVKEVEGMFKPVPEAPRAPRVNVNTLFSDMTLTQKEVQKMESAKFIVPDLIVSGHVQVFISPGNGGKTTIFVHLCEQMTREGYVVTYLNLDGNPDDLKRHFAHSEAHGYTVVSPDACEGGGMSEIMGRFRALAESPDTDLNGHVFVIDTLKKVLDVINKSEAKEVYKVFRAMSVKGATVCLLAHANKYRDDAGGLIYEGTADLRNDVDELIYLNPFKNEEANRLEVTTVPDKVRAKIGQRSFYISTVDRSVTELGFVVGTTNKETRQILNLAHKAIEGGMTNQKQIIKSILDESFHGDKKIRAALEHCTRSGGELIRKRIEGKNEYEYVINPLFNNVVELFSGVSATKNEVDA